MAHTEQQLREEIVRIGRLMFDRGWIAANDGNITVRLPGDRILATPAGVCKGMLDAGDLILCDLEGRKIAGEREPTSEMGMHLAIYRTRPDAHAVVHAHPPVATGFAVAGKALNLGILPEVIVRLGCVPLVEYSTPGTPELGQSMLPYVGKYDALLLANHGAVAWAEELLQAFFRMETVEHYARISLVAELLGGARALPRVEIEKLFAARARYGVRSLNRFEPGSPVAAEDLPELEAPVAAEKMEITREQLLALVEEALKVRGVC
jgi:L-fuculose-phosphate aldolase